MRSLREVSGDSACWGIISALRALLPLMTPEQGSGAKALALMALDTSDEVLLALMAGQEQYDPRRWDAYLGEGEDDER